MSNVYELCYYGGLVLTAIFLVLAIVLFIVLKIPKVFGELSGRAAKKGIKEKHSEFGLNNNIVSKKEQAKYYNQNSGKIKVRHAQTQSVDKADRAYTKENLSGEDEQSKKPIFVPHFDEDETAVLCASAQMDMEIAEAVNKQEIKEVDEEATDVLVTEADDEVTDVLRMETYEEKTTVLSDENDGDSTTVLSIGKSRKLASKVKVIYNIVVVNTDEKV